MRDHGRRGRYDHVAIGFNSRLDPIHAVVLTIKLKHLDRWNDARRRAAMWYRELLPAGLLDAPMPQPEMDVHHLLPIQVDDPEALAAHLRDHGIHTGVHYRWPVPRTEAFAEWAEPCPVADQRGRHQLSLPMHPHLTRDDVERIAAAVRSRAALAA
jgi:dTDP-4-amino-4,6-dideoxygalactose transaminase